MKQFKIIQQTPDVNNGLIVANFGLPIIIRPGSEITLDKFSAIIENNLTDISLPDQIINLTTDGINALPVNIPAKIYGDIQDVIQTFNDYINGAFNAYSGTFGNGNLGLRFQTVFSNSNIEFLYDVVVILSYVPTPVNCNLNGAIWIYSGGPSLTWSGQAPATAINGGGFKVQSEMRPDIVGGTYSIEFGLNTILGGQLNQTIKIVQAVAVSPSAFGVVTLQSTLTNQTIPVPSSIFQNNPTANFNVNFYQKNGYYACRIEVIYAPSPVIVDQFIYEGQGLGKWSSLDTPVPFFNGTSSTGTRYSPISANTNPGFGDFLVTGLGQPDNGNLRNVTLDFTKADELRLGFGLAGNNFVVLSPVNNTKGSFTGGETVSFTNLRIALSVSIEVMELPLESYIVGNSPFQTKNPTNGQRQQGARNNVIAYFTPSLKDKASNIFQYQASEYQWLNISNQQPMEFTSLNFRCFVTETGEPLQASSLSFNILVKENKY